MADNYDNTNYDNDNHNDNLKPGEEPATSHDVTEGGVLGAVGGAIVGAIAAGPLAPLGAIVGAVVGGIASAAAVDVVDKRDHDYNRTVSAHDTTTHPAATGPTGTLVGTGYDDPNYTATAPAQADNTAYASETSGTRTAGDEVVVPVVEEELAVGKRQVQGGGARVVSKVTEIPVEQQVTLRDETVTVDRRPADRALTAADQPFQEGVLEVEETDEEAVVSKNARVVEEVVVGKVAHDRTETIRDTVRRTDVEVEDLDGRDERDLDAHTVDARDLDARDVTVGR